MRSGECSRLLHGLGQTRNAEHRSELLRTVEDTQGSQTSSSLPQFSAAILFLRPSGIACRCFSKIAVLLRGSTAASRKQIPFRFAKVARNLCLGVQFEYVARPFLTTLTTLVRRGAPFSWLSLASRLTGVRMYYSTINFFRQNDQRIVD